MAGKDRKLHNGNVRQAWGYGVQRSTNHVLNCGAQAAKRRGHQQSGFLLYWQGYQQSDSCSGVERTCCSASACSRSARKVVAGAAASRRFATAERHSASEAYLPGPCAACPTCCAVQSST